MIVVFLTDGLGNQLFQYAAARSLAEKWRTEVKMDIRFYSKNFLRRYSLHHFNINEKFLSRKDREIFRIKNTISRISGKLKLPARKYLYINKDTFHFDPAFLELPDNMFVEGYWQSEKYFLNIEAIIRKEFMVKEPPDNINGTLLKKIRSVNAVSLHVRRGDYVTDKGTNALHGVCSLAYYEKAIGIIKDKVKDPYFFVFSDDIEWTKENISTGNYPVEYMDHNKDKDYEDLRLMYSCHHNIIANSSFSWWGAWLNDHEDKIVIAPKDWVKSEKYYNPDLLPPSWIKLEG